MTRFRFSPALLLALAFLAGTANAADPEFKVARVMESREYERETSTASVAGVALDDERITGEWPRESSRSATFEDFPRGGNVQAAVKRNQLLLKHPDGSVVTARIVRRAKQPAKDENGERD